MIVAIQQKMVTRIPRFSASHDDHRTWTMHIRGGTPDDAGRYTCQVNSDPIINQTGYVHVVGRWPFVSLRSIGFACGCWSPKPMGQSFLFPFLGIRSGQGVQIDTGKCATKMPKSVGCLSQL